MVSTAVEIAWCLGFAGLGHPTDSSWPHLLCVPLGQFLNLSVGFTSFRYTMGITVQFILQNYCAGGKCLEWEQHPLRCSVGVSYSDCYYTHKYMS